MSTPLEVLFLRLEGPLQSWGDTAHWSVRDTRLEPTKSGVVGLLSACLGWGPGDRQIAELASAIRMGVRVDRAGRVLRDYHTVVGGVMSAKGKVKITQTTKKPETVVSWRDYIADGCFLVGLETTSVVADHLIGALASPKWSPYLGRKSCVLSVPIFPSLPGHPSRIAGISVEEGLQRFPWLGRDGNPPRQLRAVIELAEGERPTSRVIQRRYDVPESFAARRYLSRYLAEITLEITSANPLG